MKLVKKILVLILSILPLEAIAHAVEYNENVSTPIIEIADVLEEFMQRLDDQLLPEKYYKFLEQNGIYTSEELRKPENKAILQRVLKQYQRERTNNGNLRSNASSILPD